MTWKRSATLRTKNPLPASAIQPGLRVRVRANVAMIHDRYAGAEVEIIRVTGDRLMPIEARVVHTEHVAWFDAWELEAIQ